MDKLWRRAWLPALVLSLGGFLHAAPAAAQDSAAQPSSGPMTSTQQDHVTASRSDSGVKENAHDGNRAVTARAKSGGTTRGVGKALAAGPKAPTTTGATAPRPAPNARESRADSAQGAPVEAHSALKENPKLPLRMPPAQGAPSAPPPNQHPSAPQNP